MAAYVAEHLLGLVHSHKVYAEALTLFLLTLQLFLSKIYMAWVWTVQIPCRERGVWYKYHVGREEWGINIMLGERSGVHISCRERGVGYKYHVGREEWGTHTMSGERSGVHISCRERGVGYKYYVEREEWGTHIMSGERSGV